MSRQVRILNPLIPGRDTTSNAHAKRYVARGLAEWTRRGSSIRMLRADDHRDISARRSVDATLRGYDAASGSGMATIQELAGLPMAQPGVALGCGRRKGATRGTFFRGLPSS